MNLFCKASLVALTVAQPAMSQDVVMRRPLPFSKATLISTPDSTPTPTPSTPAPPTPAPTPSTPGTVPPPVYGWQPSCTEASATAVCVRISADRDYVVDSSECPASQSPEADALAHGRGLFGMKDGVSAANGAAVCKGGPPTSYFVAYPTCEKAVWNPAGWETSVSCIQAFVDADGKPTAHQIVRQSNCASQVVDAGYSAFVADHGATLMKGSKVIAPAAVYDSLGKACTSNVDVERVSAGHCLSNGGYVCNSFDIAKDAQGRYSVLKATPSTSEYCNGSGASEGAIDFLTGLGYLPLAGSYGDNLDGTCKLYSVYAANSECRTTVVSKPQGGYDVVTGLKISCYGLETNPEDYRFGSSTIVPLSRCEGAPVPDAAAQELISNAGLLSYEQAKLKNCGLAANINYDLHAKVLPGGWNVKRSQRTYQYPTAKMRAAAPPKKGDSYGEYVDSVYEGVFDVSLACSDISRVDGRITQAGDAYWNGPYDSEFYRANHTKPIDSKERCVSARERLLSTVQNVGEETLRSVGERWASQPTCYEPSYGVPDVQEAKMVGANTLRVRWNRCSPLVARYYTWNGTAWVLYHTSPGNPPL